MVCRAIGKTLLGFVLLLSLYLEYGAQHTTLEFYKVMYLIIRIIHIDTRLIYNKYFDISHSFTINGLQFWFMQQLFLYWNLCYPEITFYLHNSSYHCHFDN